MAYDAQPSAEVTARDRMIQLRDFLAKLPDERFNMMWWSVNAEDARQFTHVRHANYCGTICCIGGWTEALFPEHAARDTLGLTDQEAYDLFYPEHLRDEAEWQSVTPAQAVAVLDNYLATGEIDWGAA